MAGLMRFFEDSTSGVKVHPVYIVGFSIILIALSILLLVFPIIP
jgi:preprotein translocase subunit Sec61beta